MSSWWMMAGGSFGLEGGEWRLTFNLLSKEEAERRIASRSKLCVPYHVLATGSIPVIDLPEDSIIAEPDGSVTYNVQEEAIGLHSFIRLATGHGKIARRVHILLCLVSPQSRKNLEPLLATTVNPEAGKFNSKDAEVIFRAGQHAAHVKIALPGLTVNYVMMQLMPAYIPLKFASPHCGFCKDLGSQEANAQ